MRVLAPDRCAGLDVDALRGFVQPLVQPEVGADIGDIVGDLARAFDHVGHIEIVGREVARGLKRFDCVFGGALELLGAKLQVDAVVAGRRDLVDGHDAVVVEAEASLPDATAGAQEADVDHDVRGHEVAAAQDDPVQLAELVAITAVDGGAGVEVRWKGHAMKLTALPPSG